MHKESGVDISLLGSKFSMLRVLGEVILWCWHSSLVLLVNLLLCNVE